MSDNKARIIDHELAIDNDLWLDDNAGHPDPANPMAAPGTIVGTTDGWYMVGHNVDDDVHTEFYITAKRTVAGTNGTIEFYDFNDQRIANLTKTVAGFDAQGYWSTTVIAPVKYMKFTALVGTTIEYKVTSFDRKIADEWQMTKTLP